MPTRNSHWHRPTSAARGNGGFRQDFYVWLSAALAQGIKDAEVLRDEVVSKMKPDQVFEARLRNARRGDKEDQYTTASSYATGGGGTDG